MKKLCALALCLALCVGLLPSAAWAAGPEVKAKAVLLMEKSTGEILYEEHGEEPLELASVTKVMTMLLIMEALEDGTLTPDTMVAVSANAAGMGGSQVYMKEGETFSVHDMLKAIAVASGNDACVAMAEYICGTDDIFVEKMNEKAKELGLENTHFANTNGLPADDHYSSARDIAVMSKELLSHEGILSYLSSESGTIEVGKEGHTSTIEMINTNKLLKTYNGAKGIKTGFTQDAGYCLSSCAERDDLTLIAVVLGAETSKLRFEESSRLLDYGFAGYECVKIADKNEIVGTASVEKGVINAVDLKTEEKISLLVKKGEASAVSCRIRPSKDLKAPVSENDKAGVLEVSKNDEVLAEYPLTASSDVGAAGLKLLMIRSAEMMLK